jgi:hypothetical protein
LVALLVLILVLLLPNFIGGFLPNRSAHGGRAFALSGSSTWTGDYLGSQQGGDSSGSFVANDTGHISFDSITLVGHGNGHLDFTYHETGPPPCIATGSVDYTYDFNVELDSSNQTILQFTEGSNILTPQYLTLTGCPGGVAQIPTSMYAPATNLATSVKLQDGGSWNFTQSNPNFVETSSGVIHGQDQPLSPVSINVTSPTEGITFKDLVVGQFKDAAGASGSASDFAAIITWGDGSADSPGGVVQVRPGVFNVTGTHLYSEAGSNSVSVMVTDSDGSGATLDNSLSVQDADLKANDVNGFQTTPGSQFDGVIAKFFDYNPHAPASDYMITIHWGDGTPNSSGVAVVNGSVLSQSVFNIVGIHTYESTGSYTVSAMIVDRDSSIETANSTAYVGVSPPSTTSTSTTSTAPSSSASGNGAGGIPEFPYQILAAVALTVLVVTAYLAVRRKSTSEALPSS